MLDRIEKASDEDAKSARATTDEWLASEGDKLRRAFLKFAKRVNASITDAQIEHWVRYKDIRGFLEFISDEIDEMADELPKQFVRAAQQEIDDLSAPGLFGIGKERVRFKPGNAAAAKAIRENKLTLVKDINSTQRDAIREAIHESLRKGENPVVAARRFRDSIGLTGNQMRAVNNYQDLLERGSSEALHRALRDARFDRTVEGAIDRGDVLSGKQIERMVSRYADNMRAYRAKTIARTESLRTLNEGKQASWRQIADELGMSVSHVIRTWIATEDDRTRDSHADMDFQEVKGLETPFISGDGEELMYPGDPEAPAEETIDCRCSVIVRFPTDKMRLGK